MAISQSWNKDSGSLVKREMCVLKTVQVWLEGRTVQEEAFPQAQTSGLCYW